MNRSEKRPETTDLGYMIPKGDTVLVCDSAAMLHIHKLKENHFFGPDEVVTVDPGHADMTFVTTVPFQAEWSGFGPTMTLQQLQANDYMVIRTDESEWPYIVFCTLPPGVTKVEG